MIRIDLPWATPPLSQNDRRHHMVKAKAVAKALDEARAAIKLSRPPKLNGAHVVLHYQVPDRRRRDADNLAVVLKVVQDALVAEGVIPRDDWEIVPASGQEIHPPNGKSCMWVELIDLARDTYESLEQFNAGTRRAVAANRQGGAV